MNPWDFVLFEKKKVQGLTKSQRIKMIQRHEKLIRRHGKKSVDRMVFSDEKIFCTEQSFNAKNDIVYSTTFEDVPENLRNSKTLSKQEFCDDFGSSVKQLKIASEIH